MIYLQTEIFIEDGEPYIKDNGNLYNIKVSPLLKWYSLNFDINGVREVDYGTIMSINNASISINQAFTGILCVISIQLFVTSHYFLPFLVVTI